MIPSTHIANNVLSRSFRDKVPITYMKLQRILYIVASEYYKKTGEELFVENFSTWAYGPVLFSVFDQFSCFEDGLIDRYAKNAQGKNLQVDEDGNPYLSAVIEDVWRKTKNVEAVELSNILRKPHSAWDYAFQDGNPIIPYKLIASDKSYVSDLGF